jgi:hypothetical protein
MLPVYHLRLPPPLSTRPLTVALAFRQAPSTPPSGSSSPQHSTPDYHRPESTYHDEPFDHDQQDSDHKHDDEDDEDLSQSRRIEPKKGGYHSRIEQILYENPDLDIEIVHAGKNTEGGGSYITYTIRTGVRSPRSCTCCHNR